MNTNWDRDSKFLTSSGESETDTSSSDELDTDEETAISDVLRTIRRNEILHRMSRFDGDSETDFSDNHYDTDDTMTSVSSEENSEENDMSDEEGPGPPKRVKFDDQSDNNQSDDE